MLNIPTGYGVSVSCCIGGVFDSNEAYVKIKLTKLSVYEGKNIHCFKYYIISKSVDRTVA